jgi:hypothetical protein
MKIDEKLSLKRIVLLLKKDTLETYRQSLIIAGAVFGVYLAIYLISAFALSRGWNPNPWIQLSDRGPALHWGLFYPLLFLGGFIVTSRAFYDVHNRVKSHDWFMLPASPVEKFAEKLLLTSLGYAIVVLAGYTFFSIIASGLSIAFFRSAFPVFNPMSRAALLAVVNYMVAQSIFLLGAIYFRKNHFLKTVLVIVGIGICTAVFSAVMFRLVYGKYFNGVIPTDEFRALFEVLDEMGPGPRLESAGKIMITISKIIYWGIVGPVFWAIAYLRLREVEVKDGV